jgi:hypothetical protein
VYKKIYTRNNIVASAQKYCCECLFYTLATILLRVCYHHLTLFTLVIVCVYRLIAKGPHTIWLDNFSKIRALQIPSLEVGSWQNCAWTGKALRRCPNPDITMDLVLDDAGQVIPAMPANPFARTEQLVTLFKKITQTEGCMHVYDKSMVFNAKIRTVPLKPKAKYMQSEKHRRAIIEGSDKLCTMYPVGIISDNIGSNVGLLRILRMHFEEQNQHLPNGAAVYQALNVDTNIFDRTLKVPHTL